jgi:dTDP-4-amino-4,6-dideoxygalactose transaminase
MKIPLVDLVTQYHALHDEIDGAIRGVLESGAFILGPNVTALESEVAHYLGVNFAVGVGSGTDALTLSLRALDIGPGDEVILPAYTFFATAEAVSQVGATPVFVDIDPETYCLDVVGLAARVTSRTKAILPVHLYGHPAEMQPLRELAASHRLKLIEDNAQAMGAEYHQRKTGALGDVGCLSFFPSKNLACYGDGGMVVTDDPLVAERIRKLRTHGWQHKYHPEMIGVNSRLDELQAAILRVKLRHLDAWNDRRRALSAEYRRLLADAQVVLPYEAPGTTHVYHVYVVRVSNRAAVQEHLASRGIASAIYYPRCLHELPPYQDPTQARETFPEAERAARETLAIPIFPEMTPEQVSAVAAAVKDAVRLGATLVGT